MSYKIIGKEKPALIKGVLFDMDGVVLDSEKLYTRFWREAAESFGFHMTQEMALGLRSLNGEKGREYFRKLYGEKADYQQIRAKRIELMDAYIEKYGVEPKKGIYELLSFLKKNNILCAITTSSPAARIKSHLERNNLYDKFDSICSGYEVEKGKPEPDIYIYGAASLKLRPDECLAIEDSPAGIESAFRAGCYTVAVPDADRPDDKVLKMCYACASSLEDIIKLISE